MRAAAIHALANLLPDHADLRAAVAAKLDDENDPFGHVRAAAIQALANLLPDHADLRAAVAAKLDDKDSDTRAEAIQVLTNLLPDHADLRAAVAAKLDDEDSDVRAEAIKALVDSETYQIHIWKLLGHFDWQTRRDVLYALSTKLPGDKVHRIFTILDCQESNSGRAAAIQASQPYSQTTLTCAPPSPPNSTMKIVTRAPKPSKVLANLLPDHADLRAAVAAKLDDEDSDTRAEAIRALANPLPNHADLRAAVAAKLDDKDSDTRAEAIRALTNLLPDHADLCATVAAKLDDENDPFGHVRAAAIRACSRICSQITRTCALPSPPNSTMRMIHSGKCAPKPSACSRIYSQTTLTCAPPSPPNSTMKTCAPKPSRR